MMATPADLEDFAIGFSITERLVETPDQIDELTVIHGSDGIELRMWLTPERQIAYRGRKRRLAGPTGCGLCGIESIAEAVKPPVLVSGNSCFNPSCVPEALAALVAAQNLNHKTHATHAAGFYQPGGGLVAVREDVGRHNALDKLAGALRRRAINLAGGAVILTSRVSVEMIQKTAVIGVPVLIAISAPTALAVRTAHASNVTLIAVARGTCSQVFTHPWRLSP
jgi:FdhD protein